MLAIGKPKHKLSDRTPMNFLKRLLGFILFASGIYLVGKDISFTAQSLYGWERIPAAGSVISLLSGLWIVFTVRRRDRFIGWGLIGLGVALVFLSSGIVLRPVNLVTFLSAFALLFAGHKLMTQRRFNFF